MKIDARPALLVAALAFGCSPTAEPTGAKDVGATRDAGASTDAGDARADTHDAESIADTGPACPILFGVPSEKTGLDETECSPACECNGVTAQTFEPADLDRWAALELLEPPAELTENPYDDPDAYTRDPDAVCAVQFEVDPNQYRVQTLGSADLANRAGAFVTHAGSCGLCSSLSDLVAYIRNPDLTEPVRECGLVGIREGEQANLECLMDLGFTRPCAQIWYYNTRNTRSNCLEECVSTLRDPYHTDAGDLNVCLQCDEDVSGPVFKAVAGRTRRNSGLASAICRPCETVADVEHVYSP